MNINELHTLKEKTSMGIYLKSQYVSQLATWLVRISVAIVLAVSVHSQTFTGSISGRVEDEKGGAIPNATVTLTSTTTNQTKTTQTDESGNYSFQSVQPGDYKINISAANFSTKSYSAQVVVAQQLRLDTQLSAGGITESVDITAGEAGVAVEPDNAQLSNVVNARQVSELPLITRDPYDLVALSAGATEGPDRGSGNQRGAGFAINGQRSQSANFLLDGGENNDAFSATTGQTVPLDSIQEFRVQTNNYTAEFGRGSGFVANVVTKSGTNEFHGSLYEFNRNSRLAAAETFLKANGQPKQFFNRNQFGFSIGGPAYFPHFGEGGPAVYKGHNKTFFFSSGEWLRIRSSVPTIFYVPTPQLLALSDPSTRSIFTANPVPAITGRTLTAADLGFTGTNALSSGSTLIAAGTPLFGQVSSTLPRDAGAGSPQNTFLWTGRVDHSFNESTSMFVRYAFERESALEGSQSYGPYTGFTTGTTDRNQNLTVQLTRTWSPRVVTESRFVYNRLTNLQPLGSAPIQPTFLISDLIGSRSEGDVVLPGYFATADTLGNAIPFGGPQNLYQGYTSLSYIRGNHSFKFGAQYLQLRDNRTFGAFQNAIADFGSLQNFINGTVVDYEIAIDPRGRYPGQTLSLPFRPPSFTRHYRYNEISWFAQDVYKVTPRLTLNLGVRYEYFGVLYSPGHERNLDSNFYLGSGRNYFEQIANGRFDLTTNQTGELKNRFYKPDYNNFAPRIGITYDLTGNGKTVLRAGYGIFYDRNFGNVLFNVIQNPPNYAVIFGGEIFGQPNITPNVDQYAAASPLAGISYTSSARALDQNMTTAYSNHWNVNIQHELARNYLVTLAYVGSNGIKLYSLNNINRGGSGALLGRSGRLNPNISNINFRSNSGHSTYNAFEASVDSRYIKSAGLQFRAAYTWSHAIDNQSSTFGDSYLLSRVASGIFGFQDAFNPMGDKGHADFDVRHRLVTSFNWDIPFARNLDRGVGKALLDGWAINGIVSFRTGYPFTLFATGLGVPAGNNGQQTIRPIVNGRAPRILSNPRPDPDSPGTFTYIDLSGGQFSVPPSVNGPFINTLGRNTYRAPGMQTWNMSIFRNIQISEGARLQLRGEVFNVFNHANLFVSGGSNNIISNDSVKVTRGGQPDAINNSEQHRNIQLAVKLIF
jgi:hypothetical protein